MIMMMRIDRIPHRLFSPEEAERVAAEMTAEDEDGWIYRAVHDPKGTGRSFVEIIDGDGEFVARLK